MNTQHAAYGEERGQAQELFSARHTVMSQERHPFTTRTFKASCLASDSEMRISDHPEMAGALNWGLGSHRVRFLWGRLKGQRVEARNEARSWFWLEMCGREYDIFYRVKEQSTLVGSHLAMTLYIHRKWRIQVANAPWRQTRTLALFPIFIYFYLGKKQWGKLNLVRF